MRVSHRGTASDYVHTYINHGRDARAAKVGRPTFDYFSVPADRFVSESSRTFAIMSDAVGIRSSCFSTQILTSKAASI